jgi:hypothetical protein
MNHAPDDVVMSHTPIALLVVSVVGNKISNAPTTPKKMVIIKCPHPLLY